MSFPHVFIAGNDYCLDTVAIVIFLAGEEEKNPDRERDFNECIHVKQIKSAPRLTVFMRLYGRFT